MKGKIVIITGANSGMGLATTVALAKKGAHVIMACRNEARGLYALQQAIEHSGSNHIELMICDLGSLDSIRTFASQFKAKYDVLDVLINNAGVVALKRQTTKDGFEAQIGVNHLGHFLLTNLLLDVLKRSPQGRIVNVSSGAHKSGTIHFDDPNLTHRYNFWRGYAQSKLANVLFTRELADRLQGTNVTVNSLHPGAVATNIGIDRETGFGKNFIKLLKYILLTPEQGAQTAIYLASSSDVSSVTGEYFYKNKPASTSTKSKDKDMAKRLWNWSTDVVSLNT